MKSHEFRKGKYTKNSNQRNSNRKLDKKLNFDSERKDSKMLQTQRKKPHFH